MPPLLVVVLLSACGSTDNDAADAPLVGYRAGSSDRDLVVVVETGPQDTVLPGSVLSQDATTVKVQVTMTRATGVNPALAVQKTTTVRPDAALAGREVVGPNGRALPRLP